VIKLLDPNTTGMMKKSSSSEEIVDKYIFPLLKTLKQQGRLPAIFFSLDRSHTPPLATLWDDDDDGDDDDTDYSHLVDLLVWVCEIYIISQEAL
jgi:hypothetical protein